mmetsp:Transcript_15588/g.38440  ORF Transcript_15588/g.38440 Transcript_15588/m.38440 type:complete len:387 (-) Transcript_15588:290-1450(-)|eukprot:CAMPEP_0113633536 /NCGR_PEP_ID=MMETSP0017_2-20120614/17454_1 /TAXON_ID=2856 /ORGANISM="Cylindrotheca closterium" /LENGTH=386 /DNA_ID=CAMNT_0000544181 /DNA_START=78 /DNA_END=1238 /DNA_ORIENTATION=+ /assembly_acc=CAM_ASM_000147
MTGLEEENTRLRAEVDQLRQELKERDQFIAVLSSQLTNLQLMKKESGIYSISDMHSVTSNNHSLSRRSVDEETPNSLHPLEPPRRSLEVAPDASGDDGLFGSGLGTRLDSRITEEAEDDSTGANNKEKDKVFKTAKEENRKGRVGSSDETYETEKGKAFQSAKGAIKALPRELSIINSDSDEITKYSVASGIFRLERAEMRDAYNARGLYTGEVSRKQQLPHGIGRMEYHLQSRFYDGEWNMGHWHGYGTIRNAFGDIYRGQVVNDLREGNGKLEYADGRTFEGLFKSDDAVKGTLTFPDGAKYIGELNDGKRHGVGIYYFADGSRYEGHSVNNFFEGQGKMVWEDGGFYEGEWSQGEIDGYGKEVRPDGSIRHEGLWRNGYPVRN